METPGVTLVRFPVDAEEQLAAAILYGYTGVAWLQIVERVGKLSAEARTRIIDEYLRRRGPHDQPLRALEHLYYTFDIVLDYGAYRDIQRHRMATQTRQSCPRVMDTASRMILWHMVSAMPFGRAWNGPPMPTTVSLRNIPWKHNMCHWPTLPSAVYMEPARAVSLHPAPFGQARAFSYRRIAQQVYAEIERVHPALARYIRVDQADYQLGRL
jgi:hypothetical protein